MTQKNVLNRPFLRAMQRLLGRRFLADRESVFVYECDGLTHFKVPPLAVTLPESAAEVQAIVRACLQAGIPFSPRGAGTGLSGGALPPVDGGILIDTSRMNRVHEINVVDRFAVVEPGLINLRLSELVAASGLFYAPDPSSQSACTLGGNIAENSGGPHCLKYGATTNHVLALEVVLPDAELLTLGSPHGDSHVYDLTGLLVGSEGTCAIVTKAWLRLVPKPERIATSLGSFIDLPAACRAVSRLVAEGVEPAAIEALDRRTIEAVEASVFAAGYPLSAGAVVLVELDGHPTDVAADLDVVRRVFAAEHCLSFESADEPEKRFKLWKGRKGAFGAMGRVAPDLYVMDVVVPRSRLEEAVREITAICDRHQLRIANVFHAGEGNLHPNISYDGRNTDEVRRVLEAGSEIIDMCLRLGGALSGEHGIGVEKQEFMPRLFSAADLEVFRRVRDAFNPAGFLNPGKILPTPRACTEYKGAFPLSALGHSHE